MQDHIIRMMKFLIPALKREITFCKEMRREEPDNDYWTDKIDLCENQLKEYERQIEQITQECSGLKKFNLNKNIKFKLLDEGYKHWKAHDDKYLPAKDQHDITYYYSKTGRSGWIELQMHNFISIFGEMMMVGSIFETTILINGEDLEDYVPENAL